MSEARLQIDEEVRCRCGQIGTITGIQGPPNHPDHVWVRHRMHLSVQTHIHNSLQMDKLLAQ